MELTLSTVIDGEEVPVHAHFEYEQGDRRVGVPDTLSVDSVLLDGEEIQVTPEQKDDLIQQAWDVIDRRRDQISAQREDAWLRMREARNAD